MSSSIAALENTVYSFETAIILLDGCFKIVPGVIPALSLGIDIGKSHISRCQKDKLPWPIGILIAILIFLASFAFIIKNSRVER